MAKKKSKNSDYNYSRRMEIERMENERKQEVRKQKRKASLIHFAGIILLLVAFGIGIVGTSNPENKHLAVVCALLTGLGMTTLSFYYMPIRKTAGKIAMVLGIIMLVITFLMVRQLGYFGI